MIFLSFQVPTIPIIYPEEMEKDPFEVKENIKNISFSNKFCFFPRWFDISIVQSFFFHFLLTMYLFNI